MNTKDKYGQFMARKNKKMALYEVFSKSISNSRHSKDLEKLHPSEAYKTGQPQAASQQIPAKDALAVQKNRMFQINRGRVEISIPYQLAVAILLGFLLLALIAYRFGQHQAISGLVLPAQVSSEQGDSEASAARVADIGSIPAVSDGTEQLVVTEAAGTNRIVIQTWRDENQLKPVQAFFDGHGIETEIRKVGPTFYLVTKDKYDNPQRSGTDGYKARQRIIELGTGYVPPPGFGSFDFRSAYGMKFDD
ncbi:MAG: hypothetical protein WCZ89_00135 [Phycisphaerae bacterium]